MIYVLISMIVLLIYINFYYCINNFTLSAWSAWTSWNPTWPACNETGFQAQVRERCDDVNHREWEHRFRECPGKEFT